MGTDAIAANRPLRAHKRQALCKLTGALLAALLSSGCLTQMCTDAGCSDALTIHLKALDWVSGAYVVSITESERTFECAFEKGTTGAGGQAGGQSQDESWGVAQRCEQTAGDPAELWGAPEMWGNETEGVFIVIRRAAERVPVSVRRDAALLLEAELTPSYVKFQPNGPECAPTCHQGSETLTLPAEGS